MLSWPEDYRFLLLRGISALTFNRHHLLIWVDGKTLPELAAAGTHSG